MPKSSRKPPRKEFDASQFSLEQAYKIAQARWLSVSELERILDFSCPLLSITAHPPKTPPSSGSLFLYDRSSTRNYKDDGHLWIKKRNSPKVREDHVKLRVDGKYRVAGCYVHSASIGTMHRRAYHLLDPNAEQGSSEDNKSSLVNSSAPKPFLATTSKAISTLVLVHYLDTQLANEVLKQMELSGESLVSIPAAVKGANSSRGRPVKNGNIVNHKLNGTVAPMIDNPMINSDHCTQAQVMNRPALSSEQNNYIQQQQQQSYVVDSHNDYTNNIVHGAQDDMNMMDNDIFLSLNQNSDSSMNDNYMTYYNQSKYHNSNSSDGSFHEFMYNTFDQYMAGTSMESGYGNYGHTPELSCSNDHQYTMNNASYSPTYTRRPSWALENVPEMPQSSNEKIEAQCQEEMPPPDIMLPKVVDITPDQVTFRRDSKKHSKIVISLSSPIATNNTGYNYHIFIAFCNITNQHLHVDDLYISLATEVNPYTYKCEAPNVPIHGTRSLFIVGVSKNLNSGDDISSIRQRLTETWESVVKTMSNQSTLIIPMFFTWRKATDVCFLSQISDENIEFNVQDALSNQVCTGMSNPPSSESFSLKSDASQKSEEHADLPAPPAAMATIAGALSDFPNNTLYAGMEVDYSPENTSGQNYIDGITKKRSASISESTNLDSSPIPWNQVTPVGADVDRHCKIRFVEKLTTVIAGAEEGENSAMDSDWTIPNGEQTNTTGVESMNDVHSTIHLHSHHRRLNSGVHHNVEAFLDDGQLNDIDDDQLDSLIDSLLIRIVEMLVEMSSNDIELQEELNSPDKSGFTLLHYASLYNLQSLLPVLISRGANVDTLSVRGKLTPLHLACGAGNFAVVELLTRNGCAIEVFDSSRLTPSDHAIMNGFPEITKWLAEKVGKVVPRGNDINNYNPGGPRGIGRDPESKFLLQSAFSNLSLKDKLAFNLLVKKSGFGNAKRGKSNVTAKHNVQKLSIPEGGDDESQENVESENAHNTAIADTMVDNFAANNTTKDDKNIEKTLRELDEKDGIEKDTDDDDEHSLVSSCISETDRESLDVAMSLMNEEEIDEIENSSNAMRDDVRKWMLRHNYKSLKEATLYLQSSLEAKSNHSNLRSSPLEETQKHDEANKSPTCYGQNDLDTKKKTNMATKKSIKTFKNQTLATLVIRKNIFSGGRQVLATASTTPPPVSSIDTSND